MHLRSWWGPTSGKIIPPKEYGFVSAMDCWGSLIKKSIYWLNFAENKRLQRKTVLKSSRKYPLHNPYLVRFHDQAFSTIITTKIAAFTPIPSAYTHYYFVSFFRIHDVWHVSRCFHEYRDPNLYWPEFLYSLYSLMIFFFHVTSHKCGDVFTDIKTLFTNIDNWDSLLYLLHSCTTAIEIQFVCTARNICHSVVQRTSVLNDSPTEKDLKSKWYTHYITDTDTLICPLISKSTGFNNVNISEWVHFCG